MALHSFLVTFVTATSFLEQQTPPIDYGGHMVAALALMESPAIIIGLILVRLFTKSKDVNQENSEGDFSWSEVLQEAFLNGSVFLLLGSLIVGMITSEKG